MMAFMWRVGNNLRNFVLSYCVDSKDQIQVISLGDKNLYLPIHLTVSKTTPVPLPDTPLETIEGKQRAQTS